ncbi:hypothetical protein G7Y89_g5111 [Cudoniella acicularis]|uniref:Cytochrome P450 n=1 Tax=Cudoniella acicularis TaxID=354080 RepID=A0A8H4W434_9HELO|nr:hypothetical protein G7Y89_g5111 [Cudoniella acicularis]
MHLQPLPFPTTPSFPSDPTQHSEGISRYLGVRLWCFAQNASNHEFYSQSNHRIGKQPIKGTTLANSLEPVAGGLLPALSLAAQRISNVIIDRYTPLETKEGPTGVTTATAPALTNLSHAKITLGITLGNTTRKILDTVRVVVGVDGWQCPGCKRDCEAHRREARKIKAEYEDGRIAQPGFEAPCSVCDGSTWIENPMGGWEVCPRCQVEQTAASSATTTQYSTTQYATGGLGRKSSLGDDFMLGSKNPSTKDNSLTRYESPSESLRTFPDKANNNNYSHSDLPSSFDYLRLQDERICNEGQMMQNLDTIKQAAVHRVMAEFWLIFDQDWSSSQSQRGGSPSESSGWSNSSLASTNTEKLSAHGTKRKRSDDEDGPEEPDDNSRGIVGKSPLSEKDIERPNEFACPFRKHDPSMYNIFSYRGCTVSSWKAIARLKYKSLSPDTCINILTSLREHLYRCHRAPVHCKRCWLTFKNQEQFDAHMVVDLAKMCQTKPGKSPDGITPETERKLRSRKKPKPNLNDEDKWKEVYRILFPDEEVPSPYFDFAQDEAARSPGSQDLVNYEEFIRRELPPMVQANIEEVFRREMHPVEASLIANLVDTIQECRGALFRKYLEQIGRPQHQDMSASVASNALNNEVINESSPHLNQFLESNPESSIAETRQPPPPSLDANFEGPSGSHSINSTSHHHETAVQAHAVIYRDDDAKSSPPGYTLTYDGAISSVFELNKTLFLTPRFIINYSPLKIHKLAKEAFIEWGKYMREMCDETANRLRESDPSDSQTLLENLVKAGTPDLGEKDPSISPAAILGNIFIFILASHETSANTLSFAVSILACRPSLQKALKVEIDKLSQGRKLHEWSFEKDFATIMSGYIGVILKETLRIYPVLPFIPKLSTSKPQVLKVGKGTCTIPADTLVMINKRAAQQNPKYLPAVTKAPAPEALYPLSLFEPERWLSSDSSTTKIVKDSFTPEPGTYIPFSEGFRSCIGQQFARAEFCATILAIFSEYSIELAREPGHRFEDVVSATEKQLSSGVRFEMGLKLKKSVPLKLVKRAK